MESKNGTDSPSVTEYTVLQNGEFLRKFYTTQRLTIYLTRVHDLTVDDIDMLLAGDEVTGLYITTREVPREEVNKQ